MAIRALMARGMVAQVTSAGIDASLAAYAQQHGRPGVYAGFDPTADGLHIGSLSLLMALRCFRNHGSRVVCLVGGATGMIGDPSGKATERTVLSKQEVENNLHGIQRDIERVMGADGELEMVNNYSWYQHMTVVDFLRDVGRFGRVSSMLARESVKARMQSDSGISFAEFTYQLLQAHDFLLLRRRGCLAQLGGSDQWGNITAGVDLIRRVDQETAFGVTIPLLTTSTGEKIGKTAGNAVWLSPQKTSHYDFFQYFMRAADADVERLLLALTDEPAVGVQAIVSSAADKPEQRLAQHALAERVTRLVRGDEGLRSAERVTEVLFGKSEKHLRLQIEDVDALASHLPSVTLPPAQLLAMSLAELCVQVGLVESKAACKRLVKQGGLYVNNVRVQDHAARVQPSDLLAGGNAVLLRSGRQHYSLVRAASTE